MVSTHPVETARSKKARTPAARRASLVVVALVVGISAFAGPAKAAPCDILEQPECNSAPYSVSAHSSSVLVDEGQAAQNSGTFKDVDIAAGDQVAVSASVGEVTQQDDGKASGTWSWSYTPDDGPHDSQTVTITAEDSLGASASTTFALNVRNVKPTAAFNAPASVRQGSWFNIRLDGPSDPSSADTAAGFRYAFDCGSGRFGTVDEIATCQAPRGGSMKVRGMFKDKDGGENVYEKDVTIFVETDSGTAPTVSSVTPAENATKVAPNTNVTATFSEAMEADTLTTSTITLVKKGTTTPIRAAVSYDPNTKKVTLDPAGKLQRGGTYTATIWGGNSGAKDLAGNPLDAVYIWDFKVRR